MDFKVIITPSGKADIFEINAWLLDRKLSRFGGKMDLGIKPNNLVAFKIP